MIAVTNVVLTSSSPQSIDLKLPLEVLRSELEVSKRLRYELNLLLMQSDRSNRNRPDAVLRDAAGATISRDT